MNADLAPAFALTDSAVVADGRTLPDDAIVAISFKLVPLIQNSLSRAFYGVDTSVPV